MRISAKTIERLTELITGNSEKSPYRTGPQLIEFFRDFGERDLYGQGFPSRAQYVQEKLRKFNGTETMEQIAAAALDFFGEDEFDPEGQAEAFNRLLVRDGYRLEMEYRSGWMGGAKYVEAAPTSRYACCRLPRSTRKALPPSVITRSTSRFRRSDRESRQEISRARSPAATPSPNTC